MGWYSSISRWNIVFIKRHRDIAGLVIRIHVHRQDVISQCIWKRDLSLRYCTCMRHEIALVITAYWGGLCAFWPVHTGKRDGRTCTRTTPLHELYETPTRYTRCAYFNDLINCRHGQYVQWLSSLYRFSHLSPKIIRRPFSLLLSFFSFPPFFFFYYTRAIGNWFTGL